MESTLAYIPRSVFASVLLFAVAAAAAVPPADKLLPEDTLVMVTAPDFEKMRQVWTNCTEARLWNDPAMKPFKDKFLAKWKEEFTQPLERDLGVRFDDYDTLPQGQVTIALTRNGWHDSEDAAPALLLLLDTRHKKDLLKKNLDDLRKRWVDTGKSIRTEKIRGVDFSIVRLSNGDVPKTLQKIFSQAESEPMPEDPPKDSTRKELIVGQFDSLLIAGSSTRAVEMVMVHLTGGAMPALGDQAAYEANRLALFRDAPVYGWVNLKSLVDTLNRPSPKEEDEEPGPFDMLNPAKMLTATGLGGLQTLAFNYQTSEEGSSVRVFVGVPEAGRAGLLKLFPASGKESSPPPFVPADVVKFRRCRVDGQKAWTTIQQVLRDINPQLVSGLNFLLETANNAAKDKDPGFDINRNLFGNLGDDMIVYEKAPRGNSAAESSSAPSLFLVSSPQPEELAAALKKLGVMWGGRGGPMPEREFLGRKIFSMPLPGMPLPSADPSKSGPRALHCAATSGYLALSTDASVLEEYLRSSESKQKTLRETPGLTEAAAKAGGMSTGWFGYENKMETSRALFEQLRRISAGGTNGPKADPAAASAWFSDPQKTFREWMDFSLLPPFEKISKYFHFSVYTASSKAEGLSFNWYAPRPPGLRK